MSKIILSFNHEYSELQENICKALGKMMDENSKDFAETTINQIFCAVFEEGTCRKIEIICDDAAKKKKQAKLIEAALAEIKK